MSIVILRGLKSYFQHNAVKQDQVFKSISRGFVAAKLADGMQSSKKHSQSVIEIYFEPSTVLNTI